MAPVSAIASILTLAKAIYDQAELVQGNQAQCKRLAQRVQIIASSLESIAQKKQTTTPQGVDNPQYQQALQSLQNTLQEALAFVTLFTGRSWLRRIIQADTYKSKFDEIYAWLEQDIQQLNLGLAIKQVLNHEQDQQDRALDNQALLAKQGEVIKEIQAAKVEMQKLAMDDLNRHKVLEKQLASMQYCLAQLNPNQKQKKSSVPTKLLVPFFDLSIDKLLAEGSFGTVYLGRYCEQDVAIKLLERELNTEERKEFLREVHIMHDLRSDYIVPLYAVCDEPGRAAVVMKLMGQGSLRSILDKHQQEPLSNQQKHQLALDIALGLHYLHSHDVLHRDLKSANVLIDHEGRARLSDFGLSKHGSTNITTLEKQSHAMQWMAPEVVLGSGDKHTLTVQADIYSFGVVLWEIMTAKIPYANLTPMQFAINLQEGGRETIPEDTPTVYQDIIRGCWQEKPFNRPPLARIIHQLREYTVPTPTYMVGQDSARQYSRFWKTPNAIAEKIDPDVLYSAGCQYESQKEHKKALFCYQKAARSGHVKAKTNAGMLYLQGSHTIKADKEEAHQLLEEAAKAGHCRAMRNVARQYEKGDGIPQDREKAKHWYEKAAEAGDDYAKKKCQTWQQASSAMKRG